MVGRQDCGANHHAKLQGVCRDTPLASGGRRSENSESRNRLLAQIGIWAAEFSAGVLAPEGEPAKGPMADKAGSGALSEGGQTLSTLAPDDPTRLTYWLTPRRDLSFAVGPD